MRIRMFISYIAKVGNLDRSDRNSCLATLDTPYRIFIDRFLQWPEVSRPSKHKNYAASRWKSGNRHTRMLHRLSETYALCPTWRILIKGHRLTFLTWIRIGVFITEPDFACANFVLISHLWLSLKHFGCRSPTAPGEFRRKCMVRDRVSD